MKATRRWLFALAAVLTLSAGAGMRTAQAQTSFYGSASSGSFSIDFFYDELDDYGRWVDYGDYGACWVPADVGYGWRPYMRGYWTYTDYGWTWASYEPFGWATYHYGRWVMDPYYGWVWVPGTVWAPAWVAWREADDCVGWAPLGPQVGWSVSVGLTFGNYHTSSIPYDQWCFVDRYRFDSRDVSSVVYPVSRNEVVFRRSTDATRFRVRNGGAPVNEGIRVASLERSMGRRIPRMRVAAVDSPDRGQGRQIDGRTVGFFRPSIRGSRRDLTQRVERVERQRGNQGFERSRVERGGRQERGNRIQREVERVRDNGRGRQSESRGFERRSQGRTERPTFDDFRRESQRGRQVERRESQRPQRISDIRRESSRPDRGEQREFMRQERGRSMERGEQREFMRQERGRSMERSGREERGFRRESAPERREVRESRESRGRGNETRSRDREESSDDERGNGGGNGRGHGRKK